MRNVIFALALILFNCNSENNNSVEELTTIPKLEINSIMSKKNAAVESESISSRTSEISSNCEPGDCVLDCNPDSNLTIKHSQYYDDFKETSYDIRDNALEKTTSGRNYINAYYELSSLISAEFTASESLKIIEVFPKIMDSYRLYKEGNEVVIIDEDFKNYIVEVANLFKAKTSSDDERYQKIINAVIKDVQIFTNRTTSQINEILSKQ